MNIRTKSKYVNQKNSESFDFVRDTAYDVPGSGTKSAHSPSRCVIPYCKACADYYSTQTPTGNVFVGVQGAKPLADLDTSRNCSASSGNKKKNSSRNPRDFRFFGPVVQSEATWRQNYARALASLGARPSMVQSVRECGRVCSVADCPKCGEKSCRVHVVAHCQARACPYCSRRSSQKSQREIYHRASQVPEMAIYLGLERGERARIKALDLCEKSKKNALRAVLAKTERARAFYTQRAEKQAKEAKKQAKLAKHLQPSRLLNWKWRNIVLTVRWKPWEKSEYTISRVKSRVLTVFAMYKRLWPLISFGGCAASLLRIEQSMKGFIHGHILYFGPHIPDFWMTDQVRLAVPYAGKVTIGLVHDGYISTSKMIEPTEKDRKKKRVKVYNGLTEKALREAVKYHVKSPGTIHHEWISGEKFKSQHPHMAAVFTIATRGMKLTRYGGAFLKTRKMPKKEQQKPSCVACGFELSVSDFRRELSCTIARELKSLWKQRVFIVLRLKGQNPP